MNSRTTSRKPIAVLCLWAIAAMLPLAGCASSRSGQGWFPAWMSLSRATTTFSPGRDSGLTPHRSKQPRNGEVALSGAQGPALQSSPLPAWPVAPAPAPANPLSLRPQGLDPPVTRISEETASLLEHRPTPRSSDPPVLLARAELGPLGRAAAQTVLRADETTFEQQVLRSDVPVLVDFYASWCGPCKRLAPTLEEVAAESLQARVVKVDVDESPELAARYGVRSVPSLLVFRNGQVVAKEKGAVSKSRLIAMLDL